LDQQIGFDSDSELSFSRILTEAKFKKILGKVGESNGDNGRTVF
jgi:hypothetical protein